MLQLVLSCVAFLLLHLWVSGTPLRDRLVARLGEGAYLGLFSLASVAILAWMLFAYGAARAEGPGPTWWGVTSLTRHLQLVLMLLAFLLVVSGVMTRNPGAVGQTGALQDEDPVRGVLRITRHPFLWGVGIWSAGHLLVNGDLVSLILFGTTGVLAIGGAASIDAKRRRTHGEAWAAFEARSSFIPFAAILSGRQTLRPREFAVQALIGAAIYVVALMAHPLIAGVSALG
ncbi:MAG: NnrU family protein [Phenylobacterium sp.]